MAAPVLSSVSPVSGEAGTQITLTGSGFDSGARAGCPMLVATAVVSAAELVAQIPSLAMPAGRVSIEVAVYVQNGDGAISNSLTFTVLPTPTKLQSYTDVDGVCREVPGFQRGLRIADTTIESWIRSIAQGINGLLLQRGISLDPVDWQPPDSNTAQPAAWAILENINKLGAAARLAAAVGSEFSATGEWGLAKLLRESYTDEVKRLQAGMYDKAFRPAAATLETGTQVSGGDIETDDGDAEQAFTKGQVF